MRIRVFVAGTILTLLVASCGGGGTATTSGAPASATASVPGITADTIVIGTDVPLTGPGSAIGLGFQLGLNLAVSEINGHGGVNGRQLKIVYEDDANTAQGGVEAARRLVEQDGVFANFSGAASTSAVSEVPYFRQNKVPLYESLASDPRVLDPYDPYVFMGQAVPRAVVAQYITTFASSRLKLSSLDLVVAADQAFCVTGVDLIKTRAAELGLRISGVQNFKSGDTDFTAQIHEIGQSNPQGVYICGLPVDGGRLVPQLRRASPTTVIIADSTMSSPDLINTAGTAGEGVYSFFPGASQYLTDKSGPMGDWVQRINKFAPNHTPDLPNIYSAMAYADAYVFAEGMRLAGKSPTRQSFVDALNTISDFVAGNDKTWTFAAPIGLPRTFKAGDHNGNKVQAAIVIRSGSFQIVPSK